MDPKRRLEYLEAQREQIIMAQFRSEIGKELALRRMKKAKVAEKWEDVAKYEDQIKEVEDADDGNDDYLELIDELLQKLQ